MSLRRHFSTALPKERILDDSFSLATISSDASFYHIQPQIILDVLNEHEMVQVLTICIREKLPVTFRAAGTSLSGQALGEGALIRIARGWRGVRVLDGGRAIALEPGVIGAHANRALKRFQRKIGPDPATLHSCMIGGIVANNSSGMCCGVDQNTYQTLQSMKLILAASKSDSEIQLLDTADIESRANFRERNEALLSGLIQIRDEIRSNHELATLIRQKYKIKNTLGYGLNSFLDSEDAIDILARLMIGSEGTLGFVSEITYRTVEDYPHRSCALLFFDTTEAACRAAVQLKSLPIAAAELMDRRSLSKIEDKPGMPAGLKNLGPSVAALLIETRAPDQVLLLKQTSQIEGVLAELNASHPSSGSGFFSEDPLVYEPWWNIRRGLFPSVGRGRPPGTTVIIEDVAFPLESLAQATSDLIRVLHGHGYSDAILFGHVLDGNLHFAFAQDFNSPAEVDRYSRLMGSLGELVAKKWKGSLKAEHGTGRNMAPFVELEWGSVAYSLMKRVKTLLDPHQILNPGVVLNASSTVHVERLKKTPMVDAQIDECIECGFCESHCPSKDLTVTPRQRIVAFRELARLPPDEAKAFESQMRYSVNETCATDGLCAIACPVSIDTGRMIKKYRAKKRNQERFSRGLASLAANHFSFTTRLARGAFALGSLVRPGVPRANFAPVNIQGSQTLLGHSAAPLPEKIVYFASCISRTMGAASNDVDSRSLPMVMHSIFKKSAIEVIVVEDLESQCCGLAFESKGFQKQAIEKTSALQTKLLQATENGRYSVICDTSPCTQQLRSRLTDPSLKILDSVEFIHSLILKSVLKPRLSSDPIAIHITCSSMQMNLNRSLIEVAKACSSEVVIPQDIECCGFAGDKGFTHPELTRSALAPLKAQVSHCSRGFSNSRTCEIGLSRESGISYQGIVYLVDHLT